MLAQPLKRRFVRVLLAAVGVALACACSAGAAQPLLGQRDTVKLTDTAFCRKYQCVLNLDAESPNVLVFNLKMPGNKYSGPLKAPANAASIEVTYAAGKLVRSTAALGLDYPGNQVQPHYAEFAQDFMMAFTGRPVLKTSEYYSGGAVTQCFANLVSAQAGGATGVTGTLLRGRTPAGLPFVARCEQANVAETVRTNRAVTIGLK